MVSFEMDILPTNRSLVGIEFKMIVVIVEDKEGQHSRTGYVLTFGLGLVHVSFGLYIRNKEGDT